jgi:hypothetical protein
VAIHIRNILEGDVSKLSATMPKRYASPSRVSYEIIPVDVRLAISEHEHSGIYVPD